MARPLRHYVAVGGRQVHFRRVGEGVPAVLLHASPLSSAWHEGLALALAARGFTALALDTPGYGASDPLPQDAPAIPDYADALLETLDALGVERCALYGFHTGAAIALDFASRQPGRVSAAVLEGVLLPDPEQRAALVERYAPWYPPVADGAHLAQHWRRISDMFEYWPWFDRGEKARLDLPLPEPALTHAALVDLLRAGERYPLGYQAAFTYDALPALGRLTVPAAIVADAGDPLAEHLGRLPALPPGVHAELLPEGAARDARIVELLQQAGR